MSKTSKKSSQNMLLLAGLGVGAFLLMSNKGNAQKTSAALPGEDSERNNDIPDAPKILAVNQNQSESPTPTGIVSDEEGMEITASRAESIHDEEEETYTRQTTISKSSSSPSNKIPAIISTKLTPSENAIIQKGQLTEELALKRPDLYRAIYIKKYGGKTPTQKKLALAKANKAISVANKRSKLSKPTKEIRVVSKKPITLQQYQFVQQGKKLAPTHRTTTVKPVVRKTAPKPVPTQRVTSAQPRSGAIVRRPISVKNVKAPVKKYTPPHR